MSEESEDTKLAVCQFRSVRGLWLFGLIAVGLLGTAIVSEGLVAIAYYVVFVFWCIVVISKGHLIPLCITGLISSVCLSVLIVEDGLSVAIPAILIALILAHSLAYLQKRLCRGFNKSVGGE